MVAMMRGIEIGKRITAKKRKNQASPVELRILSAKATPLIDSIGTTALNAIPQKEGYW